MSNYNSDYSDSINPDNKVNIQTPTQGTPTYYGSDSQQFQQPAQQPFGNVTPQNLYPNHQQNSYGTPSGYPQSQYQYQQQYMPYPAQAVTNRFAIMALIFSLAGFVVGVLTIVGIILGHRSLSEIKRTGEGGKGAATAALIIGYLQLGGWVVLIGLYALFALAAGASNSSY
jgi:hypothetical protein